MLCFPLQTTFPHNLRDADSPPGGRNPELSLHSPAGKCLQKTWVGWDALIRTSTIVLSVWGDVGKYKWGPKANPYTLDLRTPDCAKGCSAFFAHVNSRRPQSHKGGHHFHPHSNESQQRGCNSSQVAEPGFEPRLSHPRMLGYASLSIYSLR